MEAARLISRSVQECGGPSLLVAGGARPVKTKKAGGMAQSKTQRIFLPLWLLASVFCLPALAEYSIDWHTIAGGGTSIGGVYSVSNTIGQPGAGGPLTNGQYSVTGGFLVLPKAVQMANAPMLNIAPATGGNATISWTPSTTGFVLQETWVLSPANWSNSVSGATNPIAVPATLPSKLYRLFKP